MALFAIHLVSAAVGADAVFSPSGKTIYYLSHPQKGAVQLISLSIDTGEIREVKAPLIGHDSEIQALCRTAGQNLLLLTGRHLLLWDEKSDTTEILETVPAPYTYFDVAAAPKSGKIVISASANRKQDPTTPTFSLFLKEDEKTPAESVGVRLGTFILTPIFLPDETLAFGTLDCDLWHGELRREGPDEGYDKHLGPWFLAAYRYAPVGTPETYVGTPSATGVKHLASSNGRIYAQVSRMAGSGWGALVRLRIPPGREKGALNLYYGLTNRAHIYLESLRSMEILNAESGGLSYLCTSPDGRIVHFCGHDSHEHLTHFLVKDDGTPSPINAHSAGR